MRIGNIVVILGALLVAAGTLGGAETPWFVLKFSEIGLAGMDFNLGLALLGLCGLSILFSLACLYTKDRVLAVSSTMSGLLILFSMTYYFFEVRGILWGADPLIQEQFANEVVQVGAGWSIVMLGALVMLMGSLWVFAAEFHWRRDEALLRAAVILNGAIIDERILLEQRELIVGGSPRRSFFETGWFFIIFAACTFVLPAVVFAPMIADYAAMRRNRRFLHIPTGKFPEGRKLFVLDRKGRVQIGLTSEMDGKLNIGDKQMSVSEFVSGYTSGKSGLNYGPINANDWGILNFGELSIFFQVTPIEERVPKKSIWTFDRNVLATTLLSLLTQVGLIAMTVFLWQEDPNLQKRKDVRALLKMDVQTQVEDLEEEIIDEGEEEDTTAKKAGGEEGKFGDPDEPPEKKSKLKTQEGKFVDKIDVKKMGLNKLLDESTNDSLNAILSDDAESFENQLAIATSGTDGETVIGHGSGGMGFEGTGTGGGGVGLGRIGGLSATDTGGGRAVTANMGKRKRKKFNLKIGSGQTKGFCEKSNIRSVVRRRAAAIRACYEKQLQLKPKLKGKLTVRWTINAQGKVEKALIAKSTMKNKAVESCVLQRMRIMRFKKPEQGICVVQWPFVFNSK